MQTVDNLCGELIRRGECNYRVTCVDINTFGAKEKADDFADLWALGTVLPGCRIAKHIELVERLRARLNYLHAYYKKPLGESRHLAETELKDEIRPDAKNQVAALGTAAIAKLEEAYQRGIKIIEEDQTETVLGLCLTTLSDMQTVVDDYFNEIMAIRENVSNFE